MHNIDKLYILGFINRGFDTRSGQTEDYKSGNSASVLSTQHKGVRVKTF